MSHILGMLMFCLLMIYYMQNFQKFPEKISKIKKLIERENALVLCGEILAAQKNFMHAKHLLIEKYPRRNAQIENAYMQISEQLKALDEFHQMQRDEDKCLFPYDRDWWVSLRVEGHESQWPNFVAQIFGGGDDK